MSSSAAKTSETKAASKSTPATKVASDDADESGIVVKKSEFIDAIVAKFGLRKRDVKPAAEAVIEMLGEVLAEGKDLNLPPIGKVKLVKRKELSDGALALTVKLRISNTADETPTTQSAGS